MNAKIVCNGRLKVSDEGDVCKIKNDGTETPANILNAVRNRHGEAYQAVCIQEDGVQRHYYVHRLIAEAFVPNPENKPCVMHKDWDLKNNRADNLVWVTHKERMRRSREMGFYDPEKRKKPCVQCGSLTASKDQTCPKCKQAQKVSKKQAEKKESLKAEFMKIDLNLVASARDRQIVKRRMEGFNYEEIGEEFGISKERVRQVLNKAKNLEKFEDLKKLKYRLKKKKIQAEELELSIKFLEAKIEVLENYIGDGNLLEKGNSDRAEVSGDAGSC